MTRMHQTLMKRRGGRQRDYSPELAELARLLALKTLPRMADFGYAEVWVREDGVPIAELARTPAEQEEIRSLLREEMMAGGDGEEAPARDEDTELERGEEEAETVDLDGRELAADVYVPFAALPAIEQAHYLLVSLLASHPPLHEAFNRLDEWVRLQDRDRAACYWDWDGVRHGEFENDAGHENGELIAWLVAHKVDLARWATPYPVDTYLELPAVPPLAWVREQRVARELFPQLREEDLRRDDLEENGVQRLIAYALHALRVVGERAEELLTVRAINAATRNFNPRLPLHPQVFCSTEDGVTNWVGRARTRNGRLEVQRAKGSRWIVPQRVWRVRVGEEDFPGPHRVGEDEEGE